MTTMTKGQMMAERELGGVAEIAERYKVPRTTVSMWAARRASNGFPAPVETLAMGPVYDMAEIEKWRREQVANGGRSGKPAGEAR
jgi:hypothetical protein